MDIYIISSFEIINQFFWYKMHSLRPPGVGNNYTQIEFWSEQFTVSYKLSD